MIRTRFSPSPTGLLHIGNARAALFSALFAAKEAGHFLLRIEDTDAARSTQEYIDILQDDLHWMGIIWQEGPGVGGPHEPYQQSQRHAIYQHYYEELEKQGYAYPCFCTDQELALSRKLQLSRKQAPRYAGTCKALTPEAAQKKIAQGVIPALRFRMPANTLIEFEDLVKGPQKFKSNDIGDFIIRRADGSSSFMFCNAIDDSLMEVTHVLRGEDHLTNTPRQRMILQALNLRIPHYGHLSLITGDDGSPLSKRHGSFSVHDFKKQGYLPQAILNYLGRLGHSYETQLLFSFTELAINFNLDKLSRSPARFDLNQLLFWQKQSVMALDTPALLDWLEQAQFPIEKIKNNPLFIEIIRQNSLFPSDAQKWVDILNDDWQVSEKNKIILQTAGKAFFETWLSAIDNTDNDLKKVIETLKNQLSISGKQLFMPMRLTLTGEEHGPELAQIVILLGPEKIKKRIQQALNALKIKA